MFKRFLKVFLRELLWMVKAAFIICVIALVALPVILVIAWLPAWMLVATTIVTLIIVFNWEEIRYGK